MGKRRVRRRATAVNSKLDLDFDFDVNDPKNSQSLNKKYRRQRKKYLKKYGQKKLAEAFVDALHLGTHSVESSRILPEPGNHTTADTDTLMYLSDFVNRYLLAFENEPIRRSNLSSLYAVKAYLTLQITPYLTGRDSKEDCEKKTKLKAPGRGWDVYERLAFNLIPGSVPLPAWAWPELSGFKCASQSLGHKEKRGKHDKQRLKVLRAYQTAHTQRLTTVCSKASITPDRKFTDIPYPPMAREAARGQSDIIGLLTRLPTLIHIKTDDLCSLDVVESNHLFVFFRYTCVALEPIIIEAESDPIPSPQSDDQQLFVQAVGCSFYLRRVHRSILVDRSANRIAQEDLCITPMYISSIQSQIPLIEQLVKNHPIACSSGNQCSSLGEADVPSAAVTKETLVAQLSALTGMNTAYSLQCLNESDFHLQKAIDAFQKVHAANMLPPDAFVQ